MAKMLTNHELAKGVAVFSGYVDGVRHVGDDDFGRSGDWVDVAIFGGIVSLPAVSIVDVDDQVIVRGFLRNKGRVIDLVPLDITACKTDEELAKWEQAFNGSFRASLKLALNVYGRESKIAHKTTQKFSGMWQGVGLQFSMPLEQSHYLSFRSVNFEYADWHFDLVRAFRVAGAEGSRETYDTWRLDNPRLISNNKPRRPAPTSSDQAAK